MKKKPDGLTIPEGKLNEDPKKAAKVKKKRKEGEAGKERKSQGSRQQGWQTKRSTEGTQIPQEHLAPFFTKKNNNSR